MNQLIEYLKPFRGEDVVPGDVQWVQFANWTGRLDIALADPAVDAVEVDVSVSTDGELIAAHPPVTESDLTITALIEKVADSRVALKLDFKRFNAVAPTLGLLATAGLQQPVILNADVLATEGTRPAKINPHRFIDTCHEAYDRGILSLGWRTRGKDDDRYTGADVDTMLELTDELDGVTFPVRAKMLPTSWVEVQRLLEAEDRTLTVWNTAPVGFLLNRWLRTHTDPANCYDTCSPAHRIRSYADLVKKHRNT